MQAKSAGGKEYECIIMDDYTRAMYTRPLLLKSEVPGIFKVLQAVAENKSQKRMREIMTDNARELCMGDMKDTSEQEGIELHMSVWYSPKLNGVAERTIRVLTNAVCHATRLRSPQIPCRQNGDDVDNRTPTKALGGRMPFEVLYGAKPDVLHFRAFSTPCAVVEPTERLRKLDDRATMCFFLGYKYATGFGTKKASCRRVQRFRLL